MQINIVTNGIKIIFKGKRTKLKVRKEQKVQVILENWKQLPSDVEQHEIDVRAEDK
jgi:hypothetical protein